MKNGIIFLGEGVHDVWNSYKFFLKKNYNIYMKLTKLLKAFWIAFLQAPSQEQLANRHNSHLEDDDISSDIHKHISDDSSSSIHHDTTDSTTDYITNPIFSFFDFNIFHDISHHDDFHNDWHNDWHDDWHNDDWHNDWHHDDWGHNDW